MQRLRVVLAIALLASARADAAGQEPDSVIEIEPIVVRVLRSAVGTGTPYSVSVAVGKELRRGSSGAFLEEALRSVPGVQIQNRFNLAAGERLAVRGFGSRAQFGIRSVRVLIDGIPATLPDGQTAIDHLDAGSLGRVEMLRGPGASLYGNAAGGVLHFESLTPPAGGTRVEVRTAGGSDGLWNHQGSVGGPAGGAAYRIAFSRFEYDGFRTDPVAADGSTYGGATRGIANGTLHVPLGAGSLRFVANGLDMDASNAGSLSGTLLELDDRQAFRGNVLAKTAEDIRQGQAGATWNGPLAGLDGEVSLWGLRREFEGRIPSDVVGFDRNAGGLRAIVHGARPTGSGQFVLGAGLETELMSDDRQNWANVAGDKGALRLDQQERVRGVGLFVQGRLELAPRMAVLAGVRYDRFRFEAEDRFLTDGTDDSGVRVMDAISPSGGLVIETDRGVEVFGSVASSFETPTTTELGNQPTSAGGFNPDLDPVRGLTFEGGVRGPLGDLWSFEATVFRTDLDNELVPFEVPASPGRTFYRNAGASHHEGWEATLEGQPASMLWLRVAYTRVDGRFEDYRTATTDFSGNKIPGLAPWRVDGRIALQGAGAFLEVRGLYQDAIPVDDANTFRSPGYFLSDVRAGIDDLRLGRVGLSPFATVSNVLDRAHNTAVTVNAFGLRYYEPGPGRTFQLGLGVAFGGDAP